MSSESFTLLSGQDTRSKTGQRAGLCLLQKGFHQRYLSCYNLILDQADSYELSDQESLTLHQVKAHAVRAFAVSKAFQGGISLDQILAACYWKSHNTFTQYCLKDVAWADSELFHLGPMVAAQQIH